MLTLNVPALLKIREDITVNLSLSVSQSIEHDVPQYKVKDEVKKLSDAGELNRALTRDDYEEERICDVVTFFFSDGRSLQYRVGKEISPEDFDRIKKDIYSLIYKRK